MENNIENSFVIIKMINKYMGFFLEQNNGHTDRHIQRKDENAEIRDPATLQKKVKTKHQLEFNTGRFH